MKKIPRDISGQELINKLKKLGDKQTRQSGSHIRVTAENKGTHHITIPNHPPLKIGTLSNILNDVAFHFGISKKNLTDQLF